MKNSSNDPFRDSLQTELGRSVYDWAPIKKPYMRQEIAEEITRGFCTREGRKLLRIEYRGSEWPFVEIDGCHSVELHAKWRDAFFNHGYSPPILICKDDDE